MLSSTVASSSSSYATSAAPASATPTTMETKGRTASGHARGTDGGEGTIVERRRVVRSSGARPPRRGLGSRQWARAVGAASRRDRRPRVHRASERGVGGGGRSSSSALRLRPPRSGGGGLEAHDTTTAHTVHTAVEVRRAGQRSSDSRGFPDT